MALRGTRCCQSGIAAHWRHPLGGYSICWLCISAGLLHLIWLSKRRCCLNLWVFRPGIRSDYTSAAFFPLWLLALPLPGEGDLWLGKTSLQVV